MPPPENPTVQPETPPASDAMTATTADTNVPNAAPDAAVVKQEPQEKDVVHDLNEKEVSPLKREPPPMPYGAPPARRRLV